MSFLQILSISLGAILAENIVFTKYLGINPFVDGSNSLKTAVKTGVAITITLVVSAFFAYLANRFIINKFGMEYLRTFTLIFVIGTVVYSGETILKSKKPALYEKLGISFSAVSANTAILGVVLINSQNAHGFIHSMTMSFFSGIGFLVAIVLFASVREHMKYSETPKCLDGMPIMLITAGLIALAFMGFQGMKII